jgi:hypothetical protein
MKNTHTITGTLENVMRLPNSYNGNPRYLVSIDARNDFGGNTFLMYDYANLKTKVDSGFAYELPNLFGKEVVAVVGEHYGSTHIESAKPVSKHSAVVAARIAEEKAA